MRGPQPDLLPCGGAPSSCLRLSSCAPAAGFEPPAEVSGSAQRMTGAPDTSPLVRHRHLALLAAGIAMYAFGLGTRDLWFPDEPNTGEAAQAMYYSGDWIAPRRTGEI